MGTPATGRNCGSGTLAGGTSGGVQPRYGDHLDLLASDEVRRTLDLVDITRRDISGVTIELALGDITNQPGIDAVVNAANAQLRPGGGVAGAIHRVAGPELDVECRALAPIEPGQAVVTGGHRLPNTYVIHCLGPVYGVDEPSEQLLASCYRNALLLADGRNMQSVAFPAISTGVFGYPMVEAAYVALSATVEAATDLSSVRLVRFVLFDKDSLGAHTSALQRTHG